jgi:hypothetical protein
VNFWATRLAGVTPKAPVQAPAAPAPVQGAWFSNPLLNGLQQPAQQVQQVQQEQPDPAEQAPKTTKIMASRNARTCPECGEGNYGRTTSDTYERCYSCGFNSRFEQSMAGAGVTSGQGAASPTQQVPSGGGKGSINNFHPNVIIAHVK